jgi:D-serine deaminase-like pyridoxal phosphate-dependent protein
MANIERMRSHLDNAGKGFRPHAKTHKCPIICRLQLEAGAVGVCVAKVSEAVVMAESGIDAILITSPVTTPGKAQIVAALAEHTTSLAVVVDSQLGLDVLTACLSAETSIDVLVDLDVAMGRTGTRDDDLVARLADTIRADRRMHFRGVQHYAGHVMHVEGHAARRERSLALWEVVARRLQGLADRGIECEIVSGGGTGTYDIDTEVGCLTDLQVGSYIFMDEEYRQIGGRSGPRFEDFQVALTIACTTISQPMTGAITVDAGYKSMASDTVPAAVDELAQTKFRFAGDEHGVLLSKESMQSVRLGQVLQLVTPHCDPTVNLHDYYWVQEEDGLIHSCWPVSARGCTW